MPNDPVDRIPNGAISGAQLFALATWVPDGDATPWDAYLLRHTLLLTGIALLAARAIDSRLSWVAPALVAMPGLVAGYVRVEQAQAEGREVAFFHDTWHPMLRPEGDVLAMLLALGVFSVGVVAVIRRGERPAEPDDAGGSGDSRAARGLSRTGDLPAPRHADSSNAPRWQCRLRFVLIAEGDIDRCERRHDRTLGARSSRRYAINEGTGASNITCRVSLAAWMKRGFLMALAITRSTGRPSRVWRRSRSSKSRASHGPKSQSSG
jgi:hypothetical protein